MDQINNTLKYQEIIAYFVEQIRSGQWVEHDRIPSERELSLKLQVSRASLREALSILSIMGIIEIKPKEGIRVGRIQIAPFINIVSPLLFQNKNMMNEMTQFRIAIETAAIKRKVDAQGLALLQSIVERMKEENLSSQQGDELDWQFHQQLIASSQNSLLIQSMNCVEQLYQYSVNHNRQLMKQDEHLSALVNQHDAIFQLLIQGKQVEASQLLEKHLNLMHS